MKKGKIQIQSKKALVFLLRLTISLTLLLLLLWLVDWSRIVITFRRADKLLLIIAPIFWFGSILFGAIRWRLLLLHNQVNYSLKQAYEGYLMGSFYSIFLPGMVAGDAIRIGICVNQTKCQAGIATATVFIERVFGIITLITFLVLVLLDFPGEYLPVLAGLNVGPSLFGIIAVIILSIGLLLVGGRFWLKRNKGNDNNILFRFVNAGLQVFGSLNWPTLGVVYLLSLLFQGIRIVGVFVLAQAIGLNLPLILFFVIMPLSFLITFLPISLGGLGVREGVLVLLLTQFAVPVSDAIMLSFLIYLNLVILGGAGGLIQLKKVLFTSNVPVT